MNTRSDVSRALLALILATAAWLNGGCLDSIVSADCSEAGCPQVGDGPDAGDDRDDFAEGNEGGGGDDADAGAGGDTDAAPEEPMCEEGLDWCAGECVDVSTDPNNCGECLNQCESGLCEDGVCQDGLSGHVVLIGHDFQNHNQAIGRVLGNAVFLALGNRVDVVTYRGNADSDAVTGANQAISDHAAAIGRAWTKIPAGSSDDVPALLATADVLLIYAQEDTSAPYLAALGAGWASALDDFTQRNGTVIVLDGAGGTWQVLASAGMMDATASAASTGQTLEVVGGSDAVATNVPLHYFASDTSVSFSGTSAPVVIQTSTGDPVVLHRAVY